MSSFVRSPGLKETGKRTLDLGLFSDKNSFNDLEGQSTPLATAQFNRPHITFF